MVSRKISMKELQDSISETPEVLGDMDRHVSAASPIDRANENSVSFCSRKTEDALQIIRNSKANVVICFNELQFTEDSYKDKTLILVPNPRLAFIQVMQEHFQEKIELNISPTAVIEEGAEIHPNVYIGPHSYIGRCRVGEGTIIYGNTYVYSNVEIGKKVIIHAGTVIGADGFGYERDEQGKLEKFPHIGGVIIEDNVEIGSNVSIDKGTLGNTIIQQGTKINNLSHIAHNVIIGSHCVINARTSISGGCRIGDYSWIAPGACIRNGIQIGNQALVGMGAVVTRNVDDGKTVFGVPAREQGRTQ